MANKKVILKRPINTLINRNPNPNLYATGIQKFKKIKSDIKNKLTQDKKTYKSNEIYKGLFDRRSWLDDRGVWHVFPIFLSNYEVTIICPLCGQLHTHGVSKNEDGELKYSGHRTSHCGGLIPREMFSRNINNGYSIEPLEILNTDEYVDYIPCEEE